jgi:UDP-GlcNAc:undecaprenyl-phosphate/decaprenyl-phosphate GlcNAc-1-phosphate transferase
MSKGMELLYALKLAASALVSFALSIYLVPLLISVAHKLNFLDVPNTQLKIHKKPTPYLGGIAIYGATLVSLILFFPLYHTSVFFIIGSTLLLLLGLIDDWSPLKPYQKFAGQALATLCFIKGELYLKEAFFIFYSDSFFYGLWLCLSIIWILGVINAFNLVDVMDGLAATLALAAGFSFFVIALMAQAYHVALLLAALMGGLAGFLRYNWPPAQIYLGDAGSLFIGGVLATVPFMIPWGTFSWHGYLAAVIILAIPLLEVGTLVLIRTAKGIPFYAGSPHHFSHFLRAQGWPITYILAYVMGLGVVLLACSLLYLQGYLTYKRLAIASTAFTLFWYSVLFIRLK